MTTNQINDSQSIKPEWIRIPDVARYFGIPRSSLYVLLAEGAIKSKCLRKRGNVRGIRLISFDSLSEYIENSVE